MSANYTSLPALDDVLTTLLGENGCPWDKEQTPLTLCEYLIEESHELVDAIRKNDIPEACGELGDMMFLLTFIAKLYERQGAFIFDDAVKYTTAKMIRRHPHVFAGTVFSSKEEQLKAWEQIKRSEKKDQDGTPAGVFDSLPRSLPSLVKAYRIHSKAARAGFTWDSEQDVEMQAEAEWLELIEALRSNDATVIEHELGDIIFTLVELGRRYGVKANAALDAATNRFLQRFARMEALSQERGAEFSTVSMKEKNALWDQVKQEEKA